MRSKQCLYIDWIPLSIKKRRWGSDLVSLEGRRLAHIRSSKTYIVEVTSQGDFLRDRYKWWIDSDLTGGRGVYGKDTRKKISTGKADSYEDAILKVQGILEYFGYEKIPASLINLI